MAQGRKCRIEITPGWFVAFNENMNAWTSTDKKEDAYVFLSVAKARKFKDYMTRNGLVKALDGKRVRQ